MTLSIFPCSQNEKSMYLQLGLNVWCYVVNNWQHSLSHQDKRMHLEQLAQKQSLRTYSEKWKSASVQDVGADGRRSNGKTWQAAVSKSMMQWVCFSSTFLSHHCLHDRTGGREMLWTNPWWRQSLVSVGEWLSLVQLRSFTSRSSYVFTGVSLRPGGDRFFGFLAHESDHHVRLQRFPSILTMNNSPNFSEALYT